MQRAPTLLTRRLTQPARLFTTTTATISKTHFLRPTTSTLRQSSIIQTPKHFTFATMSGTPGKRGVHNLNAKSEFDSALAEKDSLMVLDCFATWCGPCKVIAPKVVQFSDQYPSARFYKVDVDEVPDVAMELGIRAMPTFLLFKNGDKVAEIVGANPVALESAIKANL